MISGPGVIPRIAEATTNTASWAGSGTVLLPYLFTANAKAPRSEIVETRRKMNRRVQAEAGIKGAGEGAQRPDEAQPDDQRGDEQRVQHRSHPQARRHDVGRGGGGTGAPAAAPPDGGPDQCTFSFGRRRAIRRVGKGIIPAGCFRQLKLLHTVIARLFMGL